MQRTLEKLKPLSLNCLFRIRAYRGGGEKDNPAFRMQFPDIPCRLDAVYAIHADVAENDIRLKAIHKLDSFFAAVKGDRAKPMEAKNFSQRVSHSLVVVDYQHLPFARLLCHRHPNQSRTTT